MASTRFPLPADFMLFNSLSLFLILSLTNILYTKYARSTLSDKRIKVFFKRRLLFFFLFNFFPFNYTFISFYRFEKYSISSIELETV